MSDVRVIDDLIMITDVRCNFPNLFQEKINGETTFKKGISLLFGKQEDEQTIKSIQQMIVALLKEKNKGAMLPPEKMCLRDGDTLGKDEYTGMFKLSANQKSTIRVRVLDENTNLVTEEQDCRIYSGCYVNAKVRLWFQNNKYGKRVNGELIAVQFKADGEPFGPGTVNDDTAMEGFEPGQGSAPAVDDSGPTHVGW